MASNTRSSRSSEIRYRLDMNKEFRSALKEETDGKERELIKLLSREEQTAEYKAYTKQLMKYLEKLHKDKEYLEAVVIELEGKQNVKKRRKARKKKASVSKQKSAAKKIQGLFRGFKKRKSLFEQSSRSIQARSRSKDSSLVDSENRRKHTHEAKHLRGYLKNREDYELAVQQLASGIVTQEGIRMPKLKYRKERGDGHCFYYAIRTGLHRVLPKKMTGKYKLGEPKLRKQLATELKKYIGTYTDGLDRGLFDFLKQYEMYDPEFKSQGGWKGYIKRLLGSEWAGSIEMYLVSVIFNVNVYYFTYQYDSRLGMPRIHAFNSGKDIEIKGKKLKKRSIYLFMHKPGGSTRYETGSPHYASLEPIRHKRSKSSKTKKKRKGQKTQKAKRK